MNAPSRKRFLDALAGKQPDKVPIFEVNIDEISIIRLNEIIQGEKLEVESRHRGYDRNQEILGLYCNLVEEMGLDSTASSYTVGLTNLSDGIVKDKYGVVYKLSEHGEAVVIDGPVKEPADLKNFEMVSMFRLEEDCQAAIFMADHFGKKKAHVFNVLDPFKVSWYLRGGMENLLLDYYTQPALAHDLAKISVDHGIKAIDLAVKLGSDAAALIGDLGGSSTTIMSPEHFRIFIKPYEKQLVDYAHDHGLMVIKHSDGNLWPILQDLMDTGIDGLHPIQPQCMDIGEVKNKIGAEVCLCGNIDCEELLCTGEPEEVERVVIATIHTAGRNGSYILTSSNSIHDDVNPQNYYTMVMAGHKHGVYGSA